MLVDCRPAGLSVVVGSWPACLSDQRELLATRVAGVVLERLDEGRADSPPLVLGHDDHMVQDRGPTGATGRRGRLTTAGEKFLEISQTTGPHEAGR